MIFPELLNETEEDVLRSPSMRQTPLPEYLGAKFQEGLDWTTIKQLHDETSLSDLPLLGIPDFSETVNRAEEKLFSPMSREDFESSEWKRQGIEWSEGMTEARARAYAEANDNRRYRESLIERSPTGARSILGFGAAMLGQAVDPINFIPVFGVAAKARMIEKFGEVAGRALLHSGEVALTTAAMDPFIISSLRTQGEDVGWEDGALDVIFGAAIGGLLGGGAGFLKLRSNRLRERISMPEREILGRSVEAAVADISEGRPVDVKDVLGPHHERLINEVYELSNLYDFSLENPIAGDPHTPQVRLALSEFANELGETLPDLLVDRGEGKLISGEIRASTNFGLVKIIWKHGEASGKAAEDQITKVDILRLPEVIREYAPNRDPMYPNSMEWVVERGDGRQIVYAATAFESKEEAHVVTIHVRDVGEEKALSQKNTPESLSEGFSPGEGYRPGPLISDTGGREQTARRPELTNKIQRSRSEIKPDFTTERPDLPLTIRPDADMITPEHFALHPEEEAALKELMDSGRLTETEKNAMTVADDSVQRSEKYEEAYLAAIDCVMRKA